MTTAHSNENTFPLYGWLGLAVLSLGELGLLLDLQWIATWFTPIMWTGYLLLGNGLMKRFIGRSWFSEGRRELPLIALLSVLVWLLFEAYNLHLKNWVYQGLPQSEIWRDAGYFWSFATIMPGVFITYQLLAMVWTTSNPTEPVNRAPSNAGPAWAWFLVGTLLITLPLLIESEPASYLFALVWIGFIFFLDPINEGLRLPSLRRQIIRSNWRPILIWLFAGLICGLLWETWNYQALRSGGAYWIYTVPEELRITGLHFGQMPVEGLLGFPPFALELRSFYLWLRKMLGGKRIFGESLIQQ